MPELWLSITIGKLWGWKVLAMFLFLCTYSWFLADNRQTRGSRKQNQAKSYMSLNILKHVFKFQKVYAFGYVWPMKQAPQSHSLDKFVNLLPISTHRTVQKGAVAASHVYKATCLLVASPYSVWETIRNDMSLAGGMWRLSGMTCH